MKTLPPEFEDLLTKKGRALLAGRDEYAFALAEPMRRFVAVEGAVDEKKAAKCRDLIDAALLSALTPLEDPIPPEATWGMKRNYAERLPKTVKVKTAYLQHRREKAFRIAEELGLVRLLTSQSFGAFAAAIAGVPLRPKWGIQTLCYGPGDYAGPHNDHHPEDAEARDGYLDVHVTLCTPAVAHQFLVYEFAGHLSELQSVRTVGGVTAYKLPFWHYTTPLMPELGKARDARRWVLLGTFIFASPRAKNAVAPPRG